MSEGYLAKQDILLNHIYLKNRVAELGIKQWWLAEQAGVDRKTVIRWLQGRVKSVQIENAEKLAKILECSLFDLKVENEADQLATAEDQKTAALLLVSSSLIDKLGPIGEWNVIEALLKAAVVPGLPLNILGEVYDKLTVASWRQSKIDLAAQYNLKAQEIAVNSGDKVLLASVLSSRGNIHSWRGEMAKSVESYNEALALEKYIEPLTLAGVLSNLGAVMYESGNFSKGKTHLKRSIEIYEVYGRPVNVSIAHCHLAMLNLQELRIEEARHHVQVSSHQATIGEYLRGQEMAKLIQAEIAARTGLNVEAKTLANQTLDGFSRLGIEEGLNYEFAGRVHRLIGDFEKAELLLMKGIGVAKDFPIYRASLLAELAQTLNGRRSFKSQEAARAAVHLYEASGCPLRAAAVKSLHKIK